MEKNLQKNIYMYIYIWMNHFAVYLKHTKWLINYTSIRKENFFSILKLDKLTVKLQEASMIKNYKKKI